MGSPRKRVNLKHGEGVHMNKKANEDKTDRVRHTVIEERFDNGIKSSYCSGDINKQMHSQEQNERL